MRDSEPRLLARSVQERIGLTLVPEQSGGQPFLVPAGPVVDSAYDFVLYEREQVPQEPLRLVDAGRVQREAQGEADPLGLGQRVREPHLVRGERGAARRGAARRSRWFGSVRHAVDTASTSPSTVPNVG